MQSQNVVLKPESLRILRARYQTAQMQDRVFRLLFVCTGNICRSPLAHAVFSHHVRERGLDADFELESAGTSAYHVGENADPRARQIAARHGVRLNHIARKLNAYDIAYYDVIFAMDKGHFHYLSRLDPLRLESEREKTGSPQIDNANIFMFRDFDPDVSAKLEPLQQIDEIAVFGSPDIPDPYYDGLAAFDEVFGMVERCTISILDGLRL